MMILSDKAIDYLEAQIPYLAEQAVRQAYWDALASGDSVFIAEDGNIIEVMPDGTRKFVKEILKPIKATQKVYTIPLKWAYLTQSALGTNPSCPCAGHPPEGGIWTSVICWEDMTDEEGIFNLKSGLVHKILIEEK